MSCVCMFVSVLLRAAESWWTSEHGSQKNFHLSGSHRKYSQIILRELGQFLWLFIYHISTKYNYFLSDEKLSGSIDPDFTYLVLTENIQRLSCVSLVQTYDFCSFRKFCWEMTIVSQSIFTFLSDEKVSVYIDPNLTSMVLTENIKRLSCRNLVQTF